LNWVLKEEGKVTRDEGREEHVKARQQHAQRPCGRTTCGATSRSQKATVAGVMRTRGQHDKMRPGSWLSE